VCRDAQDEEVKSAPLQSTAASNGDDPFKQSIGGGDCNTTDESGVIEDYLEEDSFGLLGSTSASTSAAALEMRSTSSPKTNKRNPLDLSPENFFMSNNDMNGKSND